MKISFEKPPLIEIVAELRWGITPIKLEPGATIQVTASQLTAIEEGFLARFSEKIAAGGFARVERLTPQGLPVIPFQPVYRFRKSPPEQGTPLYQLGINTFSAHITPPYQNWNEFEPFVAYGIETLLQTRDPEQKSVEFSSASVRYINGFGEELLRNMSSKDFMSEILGIGISIPRPLENILKPGTSVEPQIRLTFSSKEGYQVVLNMLKGLINQRIALIMDTSVFSSDFIPPEKEAALKVLNAQQRILHDSFLEMTTKIHELMQPRKELL